MATYSTLKGFTIQSLASDPLTSTIAAGTWASANAIPATKYAGYEAGTQTANLQAGGATAPPANTNQTNTSFEYDGTSWTAGNNMLTTRFGGVGFGTQTGAIAAGGAFSPASTKTDAVESYNGTSWTAASANLSVAKRGMGGAGTSTAGLTFGGYTPSPTKLVTTEKWNGSAWTEVGDMSTGRSDMFGLGIQTAALAAGGGTGPTVLTATESFDGTSWTIGGAINTAREKGGSSGLYNDGIIFGGTIVPGTAQDSTEYYDGTTWTEVAALGTARLDGGGSPAGTSSLALYAGAPSSAVTEEFTVPAAAKTIAQEGQVWYNTTSTVLKGFGKQGTLSWSSGGNLNTARRQLEAAGSGSTSAIAFSGRTSGPIATNVSETYDGTTWTEGNDILTARYTGTGFGVETAAICATGKTAPTTYVTNSEIYDGTSWTAGNPVLSGRGYLAGCGTTTSGLAIGGYDGARLEIVEEFDGTSWSEVGDLQTANDNSLMAAVQGTAAAALAFGGYPTPATRTESYNGSTWTEVNDLNQGRSNGQGSGTATAALAIGGAPPNAGLANVEVWDGTSWTETSYDLGSGRYYGAAAGSSTNAIGMGGYNIAAAPAYALNTSEELEAASTTKTFTAT